MEKLSEIITENEEIIADINDVNKESKNYKKLDKDSLDKLIKKCQNLLVDIDDIVEVILTCKKENDPTLASFDSDKKSSHAKALKAKKALEDNLSSLEKFYKKNFDNSIPKEQADTEKSTKKPPVTIENSGDDQTKVGESVSKTLDNNDEEKIPTEKSKKKSSENKKNKKSKKETKDEKVDNADKEELINKDEKMKPSEEIEATSTKNTQKSTKKGILKSSFKSKDKGKNKNKPENQNQIQELTTKDEHEERDKGVNDGANSNSPPVLSKDLNMTSKNLDNMEKNEKSEIIKSIPTVESEIDDDDDDDDEININTKLHETANEEENLSKKNKKLSKSKKEKVSKVKTSKESKTKSKENEPKDFDKNSSAGDSSLKRKKSKTSSEKKSNISENKDEAEEKEINVIESHVSSLSNEPSETTIQSQFSSKARSYNDGEDQTGPDVLQIGKKCVLIKTYSSKEDDDLSGDEGEQILLLDIMEDDWCYVKNSQGKTGYVPKSYLKVNVDLPDQKIEEALVAHHNADENEKCVDTLKDDFMPESEPRTKIEDTSDSWVQIKQSMQEKTINDVLKECGNLPSGFRYSTILNWSKENSNNASFIAYLCPKLSDSHLNFCELQVDQANSQQKIQRQLQIIKLNKLPYISEKFIIKSRHVRLCLFNGNKVLSNIHLIRATVSGKNLTTWNFNLKVSEDMKSVEFGEVFLKFNQSSTDLSILMEFCIQGFKTKLDTVANVDTLKNIDEEFTNDDLLEFSIGWTSIPLYEANGQPIYTKKGDYVINGGTPFEKGIEVDPLSNKNDSSGKSKFMLNQNKQPYVTIRLSIPSKENKELIDTLPNMTIGSTLHLVLLSFYRRILADSILDFRRNLTSTKSIYSPFLVSFPQVTECPIFLDTLRNIWNEKLRTTKDLNKDQAKMNEFFQKVYMDFIYPLTKLKDLHNYNTSNRTLLQNEERKLSEIIQKMKLDMTSILVTEEHCFAPLQFSELDFNIISRYGKHK